ncbi:hypothetical protein V1507DRAFT_469999 [Lipomyces tetrasporus]
MRTDLIDQESDELPLQFITITGLADAKKPDLASRRLVRAQARKSAYRSATHALTSVSVKPEGPLTSKFKLSSWQRRSSKKKLQEVLSDSLNFSDEPPLLRLTAEIAPINDLPIPMNTMTQELLHFYQFDMRTNSFALNPEGDWFTIARSNPAALHAFLSTIAVLRNLHLGIGDSTAVSHHRSEAVRFINRELNATGQLSDVLIAAAAVLVNAEAVESNFERASVHMRGLVAMVQLHGGLENFQRSKSLQRVITWADFCYASTWCLPLSFPLLKSLSSPVLNSNSTAFQPNAHEKMSLQHLDIVDPHISVLKLLAMLRSISEAISAFPDVGGDRVAIGNSIYVAEYELLSLQLPRPGRITDVIDISECVRLAELLYLHLAIRELPLNAHRHRGLVERLFHSLLQTQDLTKLIASETTLILLLWAFFVGMVSVTNPARHTILVKRMAELRNVLQFKHYTDFARALKNVLWLDRFSEPWSVAVWGEIGLESRMDLEGSIDNEHFLEWIWRDL